MAPSKLDESEESLATPEKVPLSRDHESPMSSDEEPKVTPSHTKDLPNSNPPPHSALPENSMPTVDALVRSSRSSEIGASTEGGKPLSGVALKLQIYLAGMREEFLEKVASGEIRFERPFSSEAAERVYGALSKLVPSKAVKELVHKKLEESLKSRIEGLRPIVTNEALMSILESASMPLASSVRECVTSVCKVFEEGGPEEEIKERVEEFTARRISELITAHPDECRECHALSPYEVPSVIREKLLEEMAIIREALTDRGYSDAKALRSIFDKAIKESLESAVKLIGERHSSSEARRHETPRGKGEGKTASESKRHGHSDRHIDTEPSKPLESKEEQSHARGRSLMDEEEVADARYIAGLASELEEFAQQLAHEHCVSEIKAALEYLETALRSGRDLSNISAPLTSEERASIQAEMDLLKRQLTALN